MTTSAQKGNKVNYFGPELFFLKLVGYSLNGNERHPYRIYSFLYFFSSFVYFLLDVYELTKHDIDVVAELLSYVAGMTLALAKGFSIYKKRTKICDLLKKMQREPFLPDPKRGGNKEKQIVTQCVWLTKLQKIVYYFVVALIFTTNVVYAVYRRLTTSDFHDWFFPYGRFPVLDVTHSPNYEICCFYQNISMLFYAITFASIDLLLASILAHISYQFKILQNYIRQIGTISHNEMATNLRLEMNVDTTTGTSSSNSDTSNYLVSWNISKMHIAKAVCYHVDILDLAEEAENLFNGLFLFVFIGTLSAMCFSINTATMAKNHTQMATHLFEAASTCFQVLIICYWGEQVSQESNLVGQAAYETNFVRTDIRFKKALAFIMRRSQNTSKLTAGKFAVVSLVTFSWILRTTYSSFMVLRGTNATRS